MSLILKQETASSIPAPPSGKTTLFVDTNGVVSTVSSNSAIQQFPTIGGSNTQIFYNDQGALSGDANLTYIASTGTLTAKNLTVTGTLNAGDISVSSIANGTSNVDIIGVSGNITTSVGGVANVLVVTTTGANVAGTLSASGNANVGNLGTGGLVIATGNVTGGNLTTGGLVTATGNITGGNLVSGGSLGVTGNANVGNLGTTGLLTVTGNANIGNIGTAGLINATGNITGGNISTGGVLTVTGNITAASKLLVGTVSTSLTNPVAVFTGSGINYSQLSMQNPTGTGSADITAYGNNGDDVQSWTDMGFTGNTFSDANYTVTSAGDGYFFVQGNSSFGGNMVIATGNTGTTKDIIFATGGFQTGNIKARLYNANGAFSVAGNIVGGNLVTGGAFSVTGNANVGNVGTAGLITATGNITGGNLSTAGLITATGNITGGNLVTGGALSVTANANIGNIGTAGLITATGNITGGNVITGGNMSATGNMTIGGWISAVGNLYVANIVSSQTLVVDDPLVYFSANTPYPYNYDIGFYSDFTGGGGNTYQHAGLIRDYADGTWKLFSNVPEPSGATMNLANAIYDPLKIGGLTATTISGTGNANVGNLGTAGVFATTLSSTGNANVGNIGTAGLITATGNINGANVNGTFYGAGTGLTGIPGANVTGTLSVPTTSYAATVSGAAQANITSVGTLTGLTVSGTTTISGNAALSVTNITTGANTTAGYITGNFSLTTGSKLLATYADLAEKYVADANYAPGTVLLFGGEHEVTLSDAFNSTRVAGVVTTNAAYSMNSGCEGEFVAEIALQGRVPVSVNGNVSKGDLMVSGLNGVAVANNDARAGTIIGKSLANFTGDSGVIEVAVGRF